GALIFGMAGFLPRALSLVVGDFVSCAGSRWLALGRMTARTAQQADATQNRNIVFITGPFDKEFLTGTCDTVRRQYTDRACIGSRGGLAPPPPPPPGGGAGNRPPQALDRRALQPPSPPSAVSERGAGG